MWARQKWLFEYCIPREREKERGNNDRHFEPCNLHVSLATLTTVHACNVNETHTEADWSVEAAWSSAGCRRGRCCCPPRPGNIGPRSPSSECARSRVWSTRPASVCRSASSTWKDVAGSSPRSLSGDTWLRTGLRGEYVSLMMMAMMMVNRRTSIDNGSIGMEIFGFLPNLGILGLDYFFFVCTIK